MRNKLKCYVGEGPHSYRKTCVCFKSTKLFCKSPSFTVNTACMIPQRACLAAYDEINRQDLN